MNPTCHSDPRYMMVPIIWKVDATRAQKCRYHFPCTIALYLHAIHSRCVLEIDQPLKGNWLT